MVDGDLYPECDVTSEEISPLDNPEKKKLKKALIKKDKEVRETQTEDMLDEMVEESFPASDPPSRY